MYVNKCIKCGAEFETKNPKRVICPNCLYADKSSSTTESSSSNDGSQRLQSYSSYSTEDRPQRQYDNRNNYSRPKSDLEEKVIDIKRVTKVVKGGRNFRFLATVVVGNRKGKVGIGTGKANEMPDAVKKATGAASKNLINVDLVDNRTISHEIVSKVGAVKVLLKPATEGTGV